ncbi:VOC family protein [Paucibacter sp. B2R-40]|uniref:VOC family protein n=1 Tax=Paucibacter sp. B2R-40 TaxID=2893554 RepID=UPI0021E46BCC|nr:VOC family protein [Paucibacter sp. B2R-40]MCV2356786.1 VOC family protein [Paucibacter sp. B2R-40]
MLPALQKIDHIHVYVSDRAAAEAWYGAVLGLSRIKALEFWAADGGPLTLSDLSGMVHLALFERQPERCRSTIALAANASDFLAWRAHLAAALPVPVNLEDHQVSWSLYFNDPDGNPFEITSYDYAELASQLGQVRNAQA